MSEDEEVGITRSEYEAKISGIIDGLIYQMDDFLRKNGYTKENIDRVLFVGGCTRVPLIKKKVEEYFGKGKISKRVNPDTCVAEGATLYAIHKIENPKEDDNPPNRPSGYSKWIWTAVGVVGGMAIRTLM